MEIYVDFKLGAQSYRIENWGINVKIGKSQGSPDLNSPKEVPLLALLLGKAL